MTATDHPVWCDRDRCSVPDQLPAAACWPDGWEISWRHRSSKIGLGMFDPNGTMYVQITQRATPWPAAAWVTIQDVDPDGGTADRVLVEVSLDHAAALMGALIVASAVPRR